MNKLKRNAVFKLLAIEEPALKNYTYMYNVYIMYINISLQKYNTLFR